MYKKITVLLQTYDFFKKNQSIKVILVISVIKVIGVVARIVVPSCIVFAFSEHPIESLGVFRRRHKPMKETLQENVVVKTANKTKKNVVKT